MKKTYKGNYKLGEIEIIEENPVFSNSYVVLYNDKVLFPNGSEGNYIRFEWNAPYGVHIFAKNSEDKLLLIRNFRHDTRSWQWEIPKGFGVDNLCPLDCSKKELLEETGFKANHWNLFKKFFEKGFSNYVYSCYLTNKFSQSMEETEAISDICLFDRESCQKLLFDQGEIEDPVTMFLVTHYISES